jgi:AraC family transcriptional regulator
MKPRTRLEHEQRIEEAVRYIVANLDADRDLGELADRVCLSRFHFHRVFQTLTGETVGGMARRLRLERAAWHLRTTRTPITTLAFEAGYATHEAFIRAFRAAFGHTPSALRQRFRSDDPACTPYDGRLPTPNGVHYSCPPVGCSIRFIRPEGETAMQVEIREMPPRKAVCVSHRGPYFMIGSAFGQLGAWMKENDIPPGPTVGIYYDDADATPAEELRSDAGAFVAEDFTTSDPRVHVVDIPGGTYAVATHRGPYDGLPNAWAELMGKWLPASGYSYGDAPGIEIYADDCTQIPPEQVRTEICIPVKAPQA